MIDISYILPAARNHNNYSSLIVEKLSEITKDYTYEILIYSQATLGRIT